MTPKEALKKYFGHEVFRFGQEEIIDDILVGKNCIVILPTGGGKSLCYQIPAIMTENVSIVVSPLIALMKDQVDSLNKNEKLAGFINSTMGFREAEEVFNSINRKEIKLLYLAPERLENLSFAERIKNLSPSFLFIDEAHCISEWGHNFRPSYRKIKEFADFIGIKTISAFTATATPEVIDDIAAQLALINPKIFIKGFERENLTVKVIRIKKKREKCIEIINQHGTPAIIYASSRKRTEEVTEFLNLYGLEAAYYHAGLAPEERKHIQEFFLEDKIKIIVATTAFGMGIDKKDIRLVIHYNMPASIENYYQEIGRAGRDGFESYAYLLYEERDKDIHNYFISSSNPTKEIVKEIYNAICDFGKIAVGNKSEEEIPVKQEYISQYLKKNISKGLLESSIKILEEAGYVKSVSELEKKYTIQFNLDQSKLKQFLKTTENFLVKDVILLLIREYGSTILNSKAQISLTNLAHKFETSEEYLDDILSQLYNSGIIDYSKPILNRSVRLNSPRVSDRFLNLDYNKVIKGYEHALKKLDSVTEFVYSNDCRMKFIINYFGEAEKEYRCNKCDNCAEKISFPKGDLEYLSEIFIRTIAEAKGEIQEKRLLNILLGMIGKEYSTYGSCINYSEDELKNVLEELVSKRIIIKNVVGKKITIGNKGKELLDKIGIQLLPKEENIFDYEENLELFNKLKEVRNKAAEKFLQTNYLICPDEILRNVAEVKPTSTQQILSIKGFNHRMFNKVGNDFLELVKEHLDEKGGNNKQEEKIPSNISETYNLVIKGYNLAAIASLRKLSEAVVSMQIETILEYFPQTDIQNLFSKNIIESINLELKKGFVDLKDLKSRFPEDIGYPQIRIVLAKNKATLI
ncbi:MAG: RecQ family ATP-dependent DNA helicase [Ignavibacteriales bacterium]|nr:RecQ family ATP-dependent DNA helicase [Ignavibacteriales bacterium]